MKGFPGGRMKVLTYNVHGWKAQDGAPNLAAVTEIISASEADLVGLNEVYDQRTGGGAMLLADLAQRLAMTYAFGPAISPAESRTGEAYGNAVLSRLPIQAYASHRLPAGTGGEPRGLLEVRMVLPDGRPFSLYATHLDHRSEDFRLAQWAAAHTWLLRDRERPHLLIGDFNALASSDYEGADAWEALAARNCEQGWKPPVFEIVAQVLHAGYLDAGAQLQGDARPTFPADQPERRIDYVFLSQSLADTLVSCRRFDHPLVRQASDHFPLLADLDI